MTVGPVPQPCVTATGRGRWEVEVRTDLVQASVRVAPNRPSAPRVPLDGAADRAVRPHPIAWPPDSADRAARRRAVERHPSVAVVEAVDHLGGSSTALAIEAAGGALAELGIRRLDVLAPHAPDRAVPGRRWVRGLAGPDDRASLVLRYPWSPNDPEATRPAPVEPRPVDALLGARAARWRRRVATAGISQVPELARTAVGEARAAARYRYAPGRARPTPLVGAAEGTHPFAVTRHRTLDLVLPLVPPALRSGTLLDVGCGDGRVLLAAREAGFERLLGWELDPDLAERAARRLGRTGDHAVLAVDALAEPIPAEVDVVFLNNPFDAAHTARLACGLGASLAAAPRPLLVIYVNPRPIEPFEDAGLVLVDASPTCSILASVVDR